MPRALSDGFLTRAAMPIHRLGEEFVSFVPDPRVLSADELRSLDRAAVEELGIPSCVLMENAALRASLLVAALADTGPVLVFCGGGNNGGDGLALVRLLRAMGIRAEGVLVGDPGRLSPDASMNLRALGDRDSLVSAIDREGEVPHARFAELIGSMRPAVVVDALLGTGLCRGVEGAFRSCIEAMNASRTTGVHVWTVSLDVPSGLDADRGEILGVCVVADLTITFAGLKIGFGALQAQGVLGMIALVSIGVPDSFVARFGTPVPASAPGRWRSHMLDTGALPAPSSPAAGRNAPS